LAWRLLVKHRDSLTGYQCYKYYYRVVVVVVLGCGFGFGDVVVINSQRFSSTEVLLKRSCFRPREFLMRMA
jgi:hypothetical protein